ncbi:MAG: DUF1559 domain-containing protein [Planctomycetes bacterium]|nr:DUF1559 domain-containing protein [Planctomycetota bacterium]
MNEIGITLIGCALRLTLIVSFGLSLCALLRRLGPQAGAVIALASLLVGVAVSFLGFVAWPHWWTVGQTAVSEVNPLHDGGAGSKTGTGQNPEAAADDPSSQSGPDAVAGGVSHQKSESFRKNLFAEVRQAFLAELSSSPRGATTRRWHWPAAIAALGLAAMLIGLGRLVLGLWAVRGYRLRSRPVRDNTLLELMDVLRAQMSCTRTVELRESAEIPAPATIGWRRPVVLLPVAWREWTETERRAVMAHELAHVCRRDYLAWLCAQISVVLHFYHPLVHWLAGQLRLQQELAADSWSADLTGGRKLYLTTLAQMALRQDDQPLSLPARSFLPTRGTFLRRIDMLRSETSVRGTPFPRGTTALLLAAIATGGLVVAGLRGPTAGAQSGALAGGLETQIGETPEGAAGASQFGKEGIDLSYVPENAALVVALRPAALLARAKTTTLAKGLNELLSNPKSELGELLFGLNIEEVEQVTFVEIPKAERIGPFGGRIVRSRKPIDPKKLVMSSVPDPVEAKYAGRSYFKSAKGPSTGSYFLPDERTVVWDREPNLYLYIQRAANGGARVPWVKVWSEVGQGQVAAVLDVGWLRGQLGPVLQDGPLAASLAAFAPLWEETRYVALGLDASQGIRIRVNAECGTEAGAEKVADTVRAVLTLAKNALDTLSQQAGHMHPDAQAVVRALTKLGHELLKEARVDRDGTLVQVRSSATTDLVALLESLAPAVQLARAAAERTQSQNNLKQIGLAMHNYHDVHGRFPPAVVHGPDGKTPHSWRVELLPFLDQMVLYQRYNFNETWDGPNNLKLLDEMPGVFHSPTSTAERQRTCIFVLTGPETIFSKKEGTPISEILDGTSVTILAVETNPAVPWTKPEDIPYDAKKPLPKLGGLNEGGFAALFADGAVRFISASIDEKTLRGLITRAGGDLQGGL